MENPKPLNKEGDEAYLLVVPGVGGGLLTSVAAIGDESGARVGDLWR